jgi:hypothetical protein
MIGLTEEQKLEMVITIASKTGWSREDIGLLSPLQFLKVYNEVQFQNSIDKWEVQYNLANVISAIYNTIPRSKGSQPVTAEQIYPTLRPVRDGEIQRKKETLESQAEDIGIKLPKS